MGRLAIISLWTFVFFLLLLGVDQFFLRVPVQAPGVIEFREFYLDFRSRLFRLTPESPMTTRKSLPSTLPSSSDRQKPIPRNTAPSPRYLYVDDQGELQFTDSLEEIPSPFREDAQLLDR